MKRFFILLTVALLCVPSRAQEPLSPEVNRMIEYLMLADDAGLDVPLYIMELSDQLAMLCLTDYMNKEIMEQGQAAAQLYGHPLVCMNYAACLMKQRKYGSALHYLNMAWEQDSRNAMIATNMARCHYEMGDDKNCEAFVNKALALDPNYGLALQLKASLLLNRGKQKEAVEYVLRSALDVWNGISVKQFASLLSAMEQLYNRYDAILQRMDDKIDALPTPLDGLEKYFKPIVRTGRTPGEEPEPEEFSYPVQVSGFEYTGEADDGIYDVFQELMHNNEYAEAAREVKTPLPSTTYPPAEYWGAVGGDNFLPDSRAVMVTLLAFYYHKIKLLEAITKFEQDQNEIIYPLEKKYKLFCDELEEKILEQFEKYGTTPETLAYMKKRGGEMYAERRNLVNISYNTRVRYWKKYMQPALESYYSDIKTCLTYVANDVAFEFVQTRFDIDMGEIYERGELDYLALLTGDVDTSYMTSAIAEEFLSAFREAEQEYQEELARTRNRRYLEWDAREKLRAAGMEGLNRNREPIPSFEIKIGNTGVQVGVDRSNRVHIRLDGGDGSLKYVYNMETGASSTTVLQEVQDKTPHLPDALKTYLQDKATLGHFSYKSGAMQGTQVVTDGRGNIIESSHVREETTSVSAGGNVGTLGANGTFTARTTKVKPKRYGASVSSSSRASLGFEAGFSESGFNVISAGASVSQGGL